MVATPLVPKAYVFVCDTGEICGLTTQCDGGNLPCSATAKNWTTRDVVPMTLSALRKYAPHPEIAMTNLIMRGYHMIRLSAPHRRESS
jgi:hypothetical protein